jgi:anti-sigma factor RsiW
MPTERCAEFHLLIQADIDGELPPADAARVAVHVAGCAGCAQVQTDLINLSRRLRAEIPRSAASAQTRAAVARRLQAMPGRETPHRRFGALAGVAGGLALAASVLLALPVVQDDSAALVSAHVRALQPGHLTDVLSTDRHTVKPWFDGRLNFAPLVKDLASDGFPLVGGRLDVIEGRQVAVMVYRRRDHMIDVFAWPSGKLENLRARLGLSPAGSTDGYATVGWESPDNIAYRAISSLDAAELKSFSTLWQEH